MATNVPEPEPGPDADWQRRERYWRRKLGRIRLGAEPIGDQVAKYRRVTWMLTAVPLVLALIFVGLFTAFGRPDVGGVLALVLFLPMIVVAWVDFGLLSLRAGRYLRELEAQRGRRSTPGRT
jgi:hypothetical protein